MIVTPFVSAALDEGASWAVRFISPLFAYAKIAGFLMLQTSLGALVLISLWSVLRGTSANYRSGEDDEGG